MATKTWELAAMGVGDAWEHVGDYRSFEEAVQAAKDSYDHVYHDWDDESEAAIFGLTEDPDGENYEHRLEVYADGTAVHSTGNGVIQGTV